MFSRVQTRYFRSLKAVDQCLGPMQALVGPNASGKTTFLDVIGFLSELMRQRGDVRAAIRSRSANFEKLIWQGPGEDTGTRSAFQLAVEAPIPTAVRQRMADDKQQFVLARYEVEIGFDAAVNELGLNHETLWLRTSGGDQSPVQRDMFPRTPEDAPDIFVKGSKGGFKIAVKKNPGGNDNYYTEGAKSYMPSFRLGRGKLALANIPADEASFPVSSWFRDLLETGVQGVVLNSQIIRQPSPPGLGLRFQTDGSNLPWVIAELRKDSQRFGAWLDHVRTALEDIEDIDTVEREEDRHRYLVVKYANGALVPSWLVSDGTLRLLALTIPAYLKNLTGVFLIEEPENGIHPRAIETVIQSLSSIYEGQVLIATHSPVALNLLEPKQVLCFAKDKSGATDIVAGNQHPALQQWKRGEPDLGILFGAGILS
ncbi:MAG: AAA family ATPase [Betaproteobacteria bacterium]|nr:AAA family ATPase [Betaproteobacteria bacterium]